MNWIKKLFECSVTEKMIDAKIKEAFEITWLRSMQKLEVKDGDIVVIRHPLSLAAPGHALLREAIKQKLHFFGYNIHVVLLDEGMEIAGVLTKSDMKPQKEEAL